MLFEIKKESEMNDSTQNQLVADLSRDLVLKVAPQEAPLFRAHSEAYFKDPQAALKNQVGKDEKLGFGAGEAVTFLTPIVLAIMIEVVKFLSEEVKKSVKGESARLLSEMVKGMFTRFHHTATKDDKASLLLTSEQLTQVRTLAFEKACQLKLSENQAALLADSVVGSLAISPT